ncbi:MAG: LLM class flavin-dependent oxidoreductase [Acidobacteriota bacterium]
MIPFSILDLCPIVEGGTAADSFRNTLDLAQHAERWNYLRYWLAEHHNMPGIASAATSVVIAHVAGGTKTIRVGSGGVMLPNHSPLVVAEQFGTLASLFPGRIDLGLGRAPGSDMMTARALRRQNLEAAEQFPQDVLELQSYFGEPNPGAPIRAVPGTGLNVPIWLLGSSLFSAQLAARLGLPFAFASHFAPADLMPALKLYRGGFQPSAHLGRPYAMIAAHVIAADTDEEARRLFTSQQRSFLALRRGAPGPLKPPVDNIDDYASPAEKELLDHTLSFAVIGSRDTVREGLRKMIAEIQPDEFMITANVYDHAARLRSFELVAEIRDRLAS